MKFILQRISILLLLVCFSITVGAAIPTVEEMWEVIQQQQKIIEELITKIEDTDKKVIATQARVEENAKGVEQTAAEVEATAEAVEEIATTGGTSSTWAERTTIGGYGELHYNNLDDQNTSDGTGDDSLNRVDFHRFVLYFGHEFTDSVRFFSEIEIEHAFSEDTDDGSNSGAVELEQAWLEFDLTNQNRFRAGLDIIPVGMLNPLHEPDTFYGVERNRIETEIIPTTWWEAGAGFNGEVAPGWNYYAVAHTGLVVPTTGSSAFRPRSGRLKVSEADDQDIAFTGRLTYTGMPGLEVGISGQYQADYTGMADTADIDATLFEGHVDYKHSSGFGFRGLYARWNIGDDLGAGVDPATVNADTLEGYYLEPAYRFRLPGGLLPGEAGVFGRYSEYDERNQLAGTAYMFERFSKWDVGLNYWPVQNVVFKFDYTEEDANGPSDRVYDGINLGLGYQF